MSTPEAAPHSGASGVIHWSGMTHVGRVRKNNEDAFLGIKFSGHEVHHLGKTGHTSMAGTDFVFAVSDGMGGAKSGEFASRITIDRLTKLMPRAFRMSASGLKTGFSDILTELIMSIHSDLLQMGFSYEECAGMGATLSLAWITPEWLYFGHVGDSRIYYFPRTGEMTQLTHDHSFVGWLRRRGELNEREARMHPRRNALQQALGAGHQFVEPHLGAVAHQPGDRFLICSDGLVDGLWDRQLEELVKATPASSTSANISQILVEESVAASGRDNTTAVVIEIGGAPSP